MPDIPFTIPKRKYMFSHKGLGIVIAIGIAVIGSTFMLSSQAASPSTVTETTVISTDTRINAMDLSSLLAHDGQDYPAADYNDDHTVGAADLSILLSKWTW